MGGPQARKVGLLKVGWKIESPSESNIHNSFKTCQTAVETRNFNEFHICFGNFFGKHAKDEGNTCTAGPIPPPLSNFVGGCASLQLFFSVSIVKLSRGATVHGQAGLEEFSGCCMMLL